MTDSPAAARSDHWLRAIVYGLLAEVATIITIIVIVRIYRQVIAPGQADAVYAAFGERTGGIVGIIGGTVYTFLMARLLTRRLSERQLAHGVVVAVAAIALSIGGSLAGHRGLPMGYLLASVLKLAAGALAGFLAARGRSIPAV
ncbi:MAG TPA: hypothetical protein VHL32_04125 [Gemmatimonadaceae bacterium]|nr:hypothetical protein [Gemmatimonadaceae bacterium]